MRSLALIAISGALALSACGEQHQSNKHLKQPVVAKPELATLYLRGAFVCVNKDCRQVEAVPPTSDFNPNDKAVIDAINDNFTACRDKTGPFDPADAAMASTIIDCVNRQIELGKNNFHLK